MHTLSNFIMDSQTAPALDIGFGWRLLSAGEKPRLIIAASIHSGTNTAAATANLAMFPSRSADQANGSYDLTGGAAAVKGSESPNSIAGLSNAALADPLIMQTRGHGGTLILPPGWILVGSLATANADGTVIWQVASAEMG